MVTATRPAKPLDQQISAARTRARKANITIVMIGQGAQGFKASVTSERDTSTEYTITYDPQTHDLTCSCPSHVVCKHIGALMNRGVDYHSNAIPAEELPITPNPNRQPSIAEETAPATAAEVVAEFPLLMDIEAEVAIVEEQMALAGFYWDMNAVTWLPKQMPMPRTTNLIEEVLPVARR